MRKILKTILLPIILLAVSSITAQVTFVLESLPENTPDSCEIYIAGDFQGWDPGHPEYLLKKNEDGKWSITLDSMPGGTSVNYKFTRGDWQTVEKSQSGDEIENRLFTFGNGETIAVTILGWAAEASIAKSTASINVSVVEENFYMPQLDRYRRITIYLPPDYDSSDLHYPVIYMHDAQNLFDKLTAYSNEWEVDETLNRLSSMGYKVPIVVGIDNGGIHRVDELSPWNNSDYGGGQGNAYLSFLVQTLKPYVDSAYRTLPGQEYTAIIGSSLGGNISAYGALKHPTVFGKSGPFSPAYWFVSDSLMAFINQTEKQEDIRFYQNIGDQEGKKNIDYLHTIADSLKMKGFNAIKSKLIIGGAHDENTWKNSFEEAYLWLFVSYANTMKEDDKDLEPLFYTFSSDGNTLSLENIELEKGDRVTIMNEEEKNRARFKCKTPLKSIDIKDLKAGKYSLNIKKDKLKYVAKFKKL